MARSRRRSAPFSLFAFQDIITSVTAIMILIVLILTLEVLVRSRTSAVAEDHLAVAEKLNAAIRRLELELENTAQAATKAHRIAETVVYADPADLASKVIAQRERNRKAAASVRDAELRAAAAAAERLEAEAVATSAATTRREITRLEDEAERLARMTDILEEECRLLAARQAGLNGTEPAVVVSALVFNPTAGRKRPVVIELDGAGVAVATDIGAPRQALGWGFVGPPATLGQWLRGRNPTSESVLIVVRPSGVERFDAVRAAVVGAGLDVGTELVGESTRIEVKQAGPP